MMKTVAPSACRYFGTKRIQSSSPAPITKMAMSRITRLRLSPKKAARDFSAGTFEFCWMAPVIQVARSKLRRLFLSGQRTGVGWRDFCETVGVNEQATPRADSTYFVGKDERTEIGTR